MESARRRLSDRHAEMAIVTRVEDISISDDARRAMTAGLMFRGARDFFLAYQLLAAFGNSQEPRDGRAPGPIQSQATCLPSRWNSP